MSDQIGTIMGTFVVILLLFVVVIPKLESDAENGFNETFDAVKSNTEQVFEKTNMTESEKTSYILNTCQIVFGNGNYRDNDVELCKTRMLLK